MFPVSIERARDLTQNLSHSGFIMNPGFCLSNPRGILGRTPATPTFKTQIKSQNNNMVTLSPRAFGNAFFPRTYSGYGKLQYFLQPSLGTAFT